MKIKKIIRSIVPASYEKLDSINRLNIEILSNMQVCMIPKTMLDFEIQLVEHCNLNCAGCSHFCPVADTEFLSVSEFEKDIKRLSLLFHKEAHFIRLMGGEPLLHPEIGTFLKITRRYFPNAIIDLDTNGILLNSMKENFYKMVSSCNVYISVTKYPIKLDYDSIIKKCKKYNVKFRFFDDQPVRKFNLLPLDLEGRQSIEQNFITCYLANTCHTLKHGKMYTCSTIPHVSHFNKYFSCDLKLCEGDFINIYEVSSGKEILDFLAKPAPFCRYCDVKNRISNLDWKKSNKSIEEWTVFHD